MSDTLVLVTRVGVLITWVKLNSVVNSWSVLHSVPGLSMLQFRSPRMRMVFAKEGLECSLASMQVRNNQVGSQVDDKQHILR